MLLTGRTRFSPHLAPSGNVCDGGKLCFFVLLILLLLIVSFCFQNIGLCIQRSKVQLDILSVIFEMKLCGKSVTFQNMVTPLNILLGGQGLNLLCLKHNIFPFSPKKGNPVLSVTNRTKCRERFIPIVLHHNVRGNICMSPWTEIVFRFFTAKNITANKYSLGLWCIEFRYSQMKWTKKRVSTKKIYKKWKKKNLHSTCKGGLKTKWCTFFVRFAKAWVCFFSGRCRGHCVTSGCNFIWYPFRHANTTDAYM